MEAFVKVGEKFKDLGRSYEVTNAGETESEVMDEKGKKKVLDNKIIVKAITGKPTCLKSEIKEGLSKFKMACEAIFSNTIREENITKNPEMIKLAEKVQKKFGNPQEFDEGTKWIDLLDMINDVGYIIVKKDNLTEAAHIDKAYVNKRIKQFNKGIIDMSQLVDGLSVDLGIKARNDKSKLAALRDHIQASIDGDKDDERVETNYEEILRAIE